MSNLEHLIENGLIALEHYHNYDEWYKYIQKDINWQGNEHISIDDLWTVCQYVVYTHVPLRIDNALEDYGL